MSFAKLATVALAAFGTSAMAQQFVMYTPGGDDTAVERMDAILAPNAISQHVHQVFGNGAMFPGSTYASLNGNKTCTTVADSHNHGNKQDGSIYWHPALYMQANDGSGYLRVPTNGHKLYYKNAGSQKDTLRSPFEFPEGFRMIAGNMFNRTASSDLQAQNITQWICHDTHTTNQGTAGGFPTGVNDCASVDGFNGAIHFPHCWNGNDFNPLAPDAHMSYPTGDIENGICPSSHPIRLPHIFSENTFDLHSVVDKVVPDTFTLAQGDPTGYGWHFDFYNGWDSGAIPALLSSCPQGEYGNEDIGSCPTFEQSSTPASDCKLQVTFNENVDTPGHTLPGCNPVTTSSPAPLFQTVGLGISTLVCGIINLLDGSVSNSGSSSNSGSGSSPSVASSSSSVVVSIASPTTLLTSISVSAPTTSVSNSQPTGSFQTDTSSSYDCPSANGTTYTSSNGAQFMIECGTDHAAGNLLMIYVSGGLTACANACAQHSGCVDVSLSGTACYLKSSLGSTILDDGIDGARLISGGSGAAGTSTTSAPAAATTSAPVQHSNVEENAGDVVEDDSVAWVTETVTVTVQPRATPFKRHAHGHAALY